MMRRNDREITDKEQLIEILNKGEVCRLAFNTGDFPYIVPLNYGFRWDDGLELLFHSAKEGRKLELLRNDSRTDFEIDIDHKLMTAEKACEWSMSYSSIIGTGRTEELTDHRLKKEGLDLIMSHYGFSCVPEYDKKMLESTVVLRLKVINMTGKAKK